MLQSASGSGEKEGGYAPDAHVSVRRVPLPHSGIVRLSMRSLRVEAGYEAAGVAAVSSWSKSFALTFTCFSVVFFARDVAGASVSDSLT